MSARLVMVALFALVSGLALPPVTNAAVTTNYSDVWWNPNEPGWGVNISQQTDFLFVNFFVYGADRQPFWYTAQLTFVGPQLPQIGCLQPRAWIASARGPPLWEAADPEHDRCADPLLKCAPHYEFDRCVAW